MATYTKQIKVGDVLIGGGAPITIQSMITSKMTNPQKVIDEILNLEKIGCQLIRAAINSEEEAKNIAIVKKSIGIPFIADIQYDYRLAVLSAQYGADKLRINPGNIGSKEKIEAVVDSAKKHRIPIRIGVNGGSLEKSILEKYGSPTPEALVESAVNQVKILEDYGFTDIIISIKSSNVQEMMEANTLMAKKSHYPLHLGVTEAGPLLIGAIKSAMAMALLLEKGIGDTIRVSLTDDSRQEIIVAKEILRGLDLRQDGVELISCPTCGRTEVDLITLVKKVEQVIHTIPYSLKVAVMGCAVNGPGEAREADLGIAAGRGEALLFQRGEALYKVKEEEMLEALKKLIEKTILEKYGESYTIP